MAAQSPRPWAWWAKVAMVAAGVGGVAGIARAVRKGRFRPDHQVRPSSARAILPRDMANEVPESPNSAPEPGAPAGHDPVIGAAEPDQPAEFPAAPEGEPSPARTERRWLRRLSNLMILAGVLGVLGLVAYFGITCAYTKVVQGNLREELEAGNPGIATAEATVDEGEFTPMETLAPATTVPQQELTPEQAAALEAEAARRAELKALREAADAFEPTAVGGEPIGRLVIPSIDLDVVLIEGVGMRQLREGPGHWPETPFPGQVGNFVVSGHRTTWGAPFFKLNEVEVGDEIFVVLPYVIARYTVTRVIIVYPDEVEEVAQRGREQISLAACHPIYSARQRIVVQGDMTSFALVERPGG